MIIFEDRTHQNSPHYCTDLFKNTKQDSPNSRIQKSRASLHKIFLEWSIVPEGDLDPNPLLWLLWLLLPLVSDNVPAPVVVADESRLLIKLFRSFNGVLSFSGCLIWSIAHNHKSTNMSPLIANRNYCKLWNIRKNIFLRFLDHGN